MKELGMLLHETAGLMRRRFEQAARPQGLTLMQWRALGLLARQGPMRQVAMGEALEASPMTVSDLAERLEGQDLLARQADPEDGRAKVLVLTEAGQRKVDRMRSIADELFAEVFDGLGPADAEALRRGLGRIKDNLSGRRADSTREDVA